MSQKCSIFQAMYYILIGSYYYTLIVASGEQRAGTYFVNDARRNQHDETQFQGVQKEFRGPDLPTRGLHLEIETSILFTLVGHQDEVSAQKG